MGKGREDRARREGGREEEKSERERERERGESEKGGHDVSSVS